MTIDRSRAARALDEFLRALGRDPALEPALVGTGARVADAWADDLLAGYAVDPKALLEHESIALTAGASHPPFVTLRELETVTMCPHHLLPSVGHVTLVYEPGARLVGVGTLSDLVDAFTRRLALQEDITGNLVDALMDHLGARGAAARLVLRHGCMLARGTRRHADVETIALRGSLHAGGHHHGSLALLLGHARG